MSEHQSDVPSGPSTGRTAPRWEPGATDRSVLERAVDAVTVRRVFGEAYGTDRVSIVSVARVRGWGGGGAGQEKDSSGSESGVGYGVRAEPAGVYVVKSGCVTWRPAVDAERITLALGLALCGAAALVGRAAVARRA